MSRRTVLLGMLAIGLAFGSAYALARAGGEPRVAQASAAALVHRGVAVIPSLTRPGAPPKLAPLHRHRRRAKQPQPVRRVTPRQEAAPAPTAAPTAAPRPPATPRPKHSAPAPPDDEPDYEPPVQVTPAPTQVAPPQVEPDPEDETAKGRARRRRARVILTTPTTTTQEVL